MDEKDLHLEITHIGNKVWELHEILCDFYGEEDLEFYRQEEMMGIYLLRILDVQDACNQIKGRIDNVERQLRQTLKAE